MIISDSRTDGMQSGVAWKGVDDDADFHDYVDWYKC
jgi:gamma-glutamylcysteine synthetase